MGQINWFERDFSFQQKENIMPSVLERLEGTPIRLRQKLQKFNSSTLSGRPDGKWSMLEHAGHLSDLEPLWQSRLEDILKGAEFLRPTDLTNTMTTQANHNGSSTELLLSKFESLRKATLAKLTDLSEDDIFRFSLHPRLKTPMRTLDLFIFVAEHDDHHLAKITALGKLLQS